MGFIKGTFLKEQKSRFLCDVLVEGEEVECYVPSSCKLSNFIDLTGKEVLLEPVKSKKARTAYALYAAKIGRRYVLLNLSEANRVVENQLYRRYFAFLGKRNNIFREKVVEGYKSDLYIEDTKTLIEIKTLLEFNQNGVFPSMKTERGEQQLVKLYDLMEKGYKVCYLIISLNPDIKNVSLDNSVEPYCNLLKVCINKGMICKVVKLKMKGLLPEICGLIELKI